MDDYKDFAWGWVSGFFFGVSILMCVITAFGGLRQHGEKAVQQEAVEAGHAYYEADPATGEVTFKWKE